MVLAPDKVISDSQDHDTSIDDDVPIHTRSRDGCGLGEEAEDPDPGQKHQRSDVDGQSHNAQRPSAVRQGRSTNTSEDKTADGDDVSGEQGVGGHRADGIERNGRADVDKRQERGEDEGDAHCIERDVPAWLDLADEVGERKTTVTSWTMSASFHKAFIGNLPNDQVCLDTLAKVEIQLDVVLTMMIAIMTDVPPSERVA